MAAKPSSNEPDISRPPQEVAEVKVIACELPASHDLPLSRFSRAELHRWSSSVA
jgi:hypothetical protein